MADDIFDRFRKLSTAVISDVMQAAGVPHQVLHHGIKPLKRGGVLAGPAFCVRGEIILGNAPKRPGPNPRFEMFRQMPAGSVVVVESGGYETSVVFGGNIVNAFRHKECLGIVTDGGVRDRDDIVELDVQVYCRFTTPLSSGGEWAITQLQAPVSLAGQSHSQVTVHPGDVVVADSDGAIVVPGRAALSILEDSEKLAELEDQINAGLNTGADPGEVFGSFKRFEHVRRIDLPST